MWRMSTSQPEKRMGNAAVIIDEMTDGSKAYNVAFRDQSGELIATLAAESKGHANRIAAEINSASWIQFHAVR